MIRSNTLSGLLFGFSVVVAAIGVVVVSVFKIAVFGKAYPDDGFGLLSERQGVSFGSFLVFLLGALLIFLAMRGIYNGVLPAFGSDPYLVFAQAPLLYLLSFSALFFGGTGLVWLSWKVWRTRKASRKPGAISNRKH
jgi:hypothetical protein